MLTLEQLAKLTDSAFSGDKNVKINSVAGLGEAEQGQISFVSNRKYINKLENSAASAVILNASLAKQYNGNALINDDPYLTFARVLEALYAEPNSSKTAHESANIADDVIVPKTATIGPNVVIESGVKIQDNVSIDAGCFIGKKSHLAAGVHLNPNVTIYKETQIGKNSIIHAGAIIGADGFGFAPTPEKTWYKILQVGTVIIGENVEIGASTTIDRAALGATMICNGVKIDNQVHIGHNVKIDEHSIIVAGTLIAGSTSIGKRCQIGGAVAISGHLKITDDVIITGRSMVTNSIKVAGMYSSGITTEENTKWRRNAARFRSLDKLAKKIRQLEKKLNGK